MSAPSILRSVTVRAICPNGEVWSYRTRAPVGNLKTDGLRTQSRRASAVFQSVAVSLGNGRLLTARIERTRTHPALLAVSAFIQQGTRWICKCFGTLLSARSSSFFPLVNGSAKPTNGVALTLKFSPIPFVAAVAHGNQHDSRSDGNAQNLIGEVRNVQR